MKETNVQKIRLGVFIVIGTVVFVLAVYFIGNKQNLFGSTMNIHAIFSNVNGLQPGNNVRFSGIDVGTVRSLQMINDTAIKVQLTLDKKISPYVHTNAIATINSDGLVGSMVVNIIPGSGLGKPIHDGTQIRSYERTRTEDMLKTLTVTNENAALLTEDLLKITRQINQGKGSVGLLIKDEKVATDVKYTMHNLQKSTAEVNLAMKKINIILGGLDGNNNMVGIFKDSTLANQLRHVITKLAQSSNHLDHAIQNADSLIIQYKNGRGALHYLVKNPDSAAKIDSVLTEINKVTLLLQQDLKALQESFLLRGYFRKNAKEKTRKSKKSVN